jgi:hypothetical protein
MSTNVEQLEGALLSLARSGTIKDRLTDAYRNHLAHVCAEELPTQVRDEFRACSEALTREPPLRGEDAVRASVRKLSDREANEIASCVVHMLTVVAREAGLDSTVALQEQLLSGGARVIKPLKSVPQVLALYAAEA